MTHNELSFREKTMLNTREIPDRLFTRLYIYPDKYPGKYLECMHLKVLRSPYGQNLRNHTF